MSVFTFHLFTFVHFHLLVCKTGFSVSLISKSSIRTLGLRTHAGVLSFSSTIWVFFWTHLFFLPSVHPKPFLSIGGLVCNFLWDQKNSEVIRLLPSWLLCQLALPACPSHSQHRLRLLAPGGGPSLVRWSFSLRCAHLSLSTGC